MESNLLHKLLEYGSYALIGVIGWFLRRHVDKSDTKEKEQDIKLDALDKRVDGHDISRADFKAQINNVYHLLQKMDKNIDKLLDRK